MMTDLARLENRLRELGPVAVAVSGGVDSMTLAWVAHRVNAETRVYHALSPAVPHQATARVKKYAAAENWRLHLIDAGETGDLDYLANPANRCYYCKTNLYDTVRDQTALPVISGTNTDDLGDYRPGLVAAQEHAVRHPYVEVGIDKQGLRDIAKSLGLDDLYDLPAAPCLSSRVTTGIAIDADLLPVINEVEQAVWTLLDESLPLAGVRCRVRPEGAAIQLQSRVTVDANADWAAPVIEKAREILTRHGYAGLAEHVSVEPYERGSAFLIETLQVE